MPENHRNWTPSHEAGHATVAIAHGVLPDYVVLGPPEAPEGGRALLPGGRNTTVDQEIRFASAGSAGELHVYRTARGHLPQDRMRAAILDRARADKATFYLNVDAARMNLNTQFQLDETYIGHARNTSLRDIQANTKIFELIREHLDQHGFMGRASLALAAQGLPATTTSLQEDAEQRAALRL